MMNIKQTPEDQFTQDVENFVGNAEKLEGLATDATDIAIALDNYLRYLNDIGTFIPWIKLPLLIFRSLFRAVTLFAISTMDTASRSVKILTAVVMLALTIAMIFVSGAAGLALNSIILGLDLMQYGWALGRQLWQYFSDDSEQRQLETQKCIAEYIALVNEHNRLVLKNRMPSKALAQSISSLKEKINTLVDDKNKCDTDLLDAFKSFLFTLLSLTGMVLLLFPPTMIAGVIILAATALFGIVEKTLNPCERLYQLYQRFSCTSAPPYPVLLETDYEMELKEENGLAPSSQKIQDKAAENAAPHHEAGIDTRVIQHLFNRMQLTKQESKMTLFARANRISANQAANGETQYAKSDCSSVPSRYNGKSSP